MYRHSEATDIGNLNLGGDVGYVVVKVYGHEGRSSLPHVHLVNDKFNCSISLLSAKYFIHDYRHDILDDNQMILFNDFIHSEDDDGFTLWETAWYESISKFGNPSHFRKPSIIPDYSNICGTVFMQHKKGPVRNTDKSKIRMINRKESDRHSDAWIDSVNMTGYGEVRIIIEGCEGKCHKPHFHLKTIDGLNICSISLEHPTYYVHEPDEKYNELTIDQKKELYSRLFDKCRNIFDHSIYDDIWLVWYELFNPTSKYLCMKSPVNMPDYNKLDGITYSRYRRKNKLTRKHKKSLMKGIKL